MRPYSVVVPSKAWHNFVPMRVENLFAVLITLQFLVIISHDWLEIPGWTHGRQVQAVIGRQKLLWATAINAIFPGTAVAFALWFVGKPHPRYVASYWAIYCGITVFSAIAMWYVPYLFGADEKKQTEYAKMYAGTRHVFPARGNNPRPNLLHVVFHLLFVVNFALAVMIRFRWV
jgi:hypothetical protein